MFFYNSLEYHKIQIFVETQCISSKHILAIALSNLKERNENREIIQTLILWT